MNQSAQDYAATADVAIVGAGPIGLEMAATLKRASVEYLHFDAAQIGTIESRRYEMPLTQIETN